MEKLEFKKLLFKTAFCAMVCDGHVDPREIEEIKKIDANTSYFNDVDMTDELNQLIDEVSSKGKLLLLELFQTLRENKFTTVQELLIIEITIRVINADNIIDDNEVRFIRLLRSKLDVENEILRDRFGKIPYLMNMNYDNINKNVDQGNQDAMKDFDLTANIDLSKLSIN